MPLSDRYDYTSHDGTVTVTLYDAAFTCTKCRKIKPASEVGLRKMKDGVVRNQPQCKSCRKSQKC